MELTQRQTCLEFRHLYILALCCTNSTNFFIRRRRRKRRRAAVLSEGYRRAASSEDKVFLDGSSDPAVASKEDTPAARDFPKSSLNARRSALAAPSRRLRGMNPVSRVKANLRSTRLTDAQQSSSRLSGTSKELFVGAEAIDTGENSSEEKEERRSTWQSATSCEGSKFYGLRQKRESKLLPKMSLARHRKKRPAATAAAVALARDINYAEAGSDDEDFHPEEEKKAPVRERGRPRKQPAIKNISSGDDEPQGTSKTAEPEKGNAKKRPRSNEDEEASTSKRFKTEEKSRKVGLFYVFRSNFLCVVYS